MKGETKSFFIFDTFDEAMNLHKSLFQVFNSEHLVTYADIYFILNKTYKNCPYDFYKFGWTSLMESKVRPCDDGKSWCVKLPKPLNLTAGDDSKAHAITCITNAMDAIACDEPKQGIRDLKKALLYLYKDKKENE